MPNIRQDIFQKLSLEKEIYLSLKPFQSPLLLQSNFSKQSTVRGGQLAKWSQIVWVLVLIEVPGWGKNRQTN